MIELTHTWIKSLDRIRVEETTVVNPDHIVRMSRTVLHAADGSQSVTRIFLTTGHTLDVLEGPIAIVRMIEDR